MRAALILLAAVALGFYITVKRFQHRFLPKSVHKLVTGGKNPD